MLRHEVKESDKMAWLGFITFLMIYWCIFMAAVTGRLGWGLLTGWLVPILAMTLSFRSGMAVNGLMVLVCLLMFLFCRHGLTDIRMWNTKQRKRHSVLFCVLYMATFLLMFYSLAMAQIHGYLLNLQGWGSENLRFWRLLLTIIPLLALNYTYTMMLYTAIDRSILKKQELVLLSCRLFISSKSGIDKGIYQGYFLEGVSNGVTYHFQMTARTYYMLKKETSLRLQIQTGLFGGIYVMELDDPEFLKRVRRRDRHDLKVGTVLFLLAFAAGIFIFWHL